METITQNFSVYALRQAIRQEYCEVAQNPKKGFHFLSGRPLVQTLGYALDLLENIPETAVESFAGVGNPFQLGVLDAGSTVVDIGCGAGMDALIAAAMVGAEGMVTGIDMTLEMIEKARYNAAEADATNVQFLHAQAEFLPIEDETVDVVISNGAINLCPDKETIFDEIFRILKPGGRLQIADVLLQRPVSTAAKDRVHLWTTCVAGGLLEAEYRDVLELAGFQRIQIGNAYDVFGGAPVASSAAQFDARGYNIYAEK